MSLPFIVPWPNYSFNPNLTAWKAWKYRGALGIFVEHEVSLLQ